MAHPRVKQIANFWGTNTMAGRKTVKAMKIKNTPLARSRPKYMRDFPDGTLLVAVLKLPGSSLTPLETLSNIKITNRKIDQCLRLYWCFKKRKFDKLLKETSTKKLVVMHHGSLNKYSMCKN